MGIALIGGGLGSGISVVPRQAKPAAAGGGAASTFAAQAAADGATHYYALDDEADSIGAWGALTYQEGNANYATVGAAGNGWTRLATGYPTAAASAVEGTSFSDTSGSNHYLKVPTGGSDFARTTDRCILLAWKSDATTSLNSLIVNGEDGNISQTFWGNLYHYSVNDSVRIWDGAAQALSVTVAKGTWHILCYGWDATGGQYVVRVRPISGSVTSATYTEPAGSSSPTHDELRICGGSSTFSADQGCAVAMIATFDKVLSAAEVDAYGDLLDLGLVS